MSLKGYEVVHFQPFDPVHKRTEAAVKAKDGKTFKVTKGAPQVILALSANAEQVKPAVEKAVNEFAARGFRSLGVARAEGDGQWQFVGVLPLFDPPREDAKATIATALAMGVKIKMVTGDALAIAQETAKKLDMGTNILDAGGLGDSKKQETAEVAESIEKADGFAQVFPEHKFHIVDVLQKRGHIVGMTGDGVNDAPALKKADCGIAVSGATDAARAAAAIVLLTPGLSVIIDAIKESRRIFQRMNSYAIYRIAETLRVLFFMTLAILVFNFYPLTAVMIVMLALLNDGAILSIAYDNVHYKDKPEAWNMRMVLGISTVLGVIGVVSAFGLFYLGERVFHLDRAHIQTLMYLKLSVAGHLTIFLTRTRGPFWSIRPAQDFMGGRARHANRGDVDRGLWAVHDAPRLGLGTVRLGLCSGLVPRERPRETARVSGVRSNYLTPIGEETMTPTINRSSVDLADKRAARIPSLAADLASPDPTVRTKARKALVAIGKLAVPSLIRLLSHRKPHVRWEAAKALCGIADPIAASALVNALEDRDGDVRWLAAEGVAALGRDALQPLLAALLEGSKPSWLYEGAHHVCHTLVKRKRLGPILRPLLAALKQSEPEVAVPPAAYTALSRLRKLS